MSRLGYRSPPAPVQGSTPLDAVDAVLAMVSQRKLVTAEEARRMLHGVQVAVEGEAPEARIAGIIMDATTTYSDQMVLERSRLVDPLLDIRLVICS